MESYPYADYTSTLPQLTFDALNASDSDLLLLLLLVRATTINELEGLHLCGKSKRTFLLHLLEEKDGALLHLWIVYGNLLPAAP